MLGFALLNLLLTSVSPTPMFQTEFEFTLPKGYLDEDGNLHRQGVMRLAKAIDEIMPLRDPRVQANPAYATVVILSRVVVKLGALENIGSSLIENHYAADLNYLYDFYQKINDVAQMQSFQEEPPSQESAESA